MKPEQLIAELEAALHQGESHDWRLLAPLVLDALKAMQAAVERLTAERDKALARNAFLHNETGKALEIIASRIELNPPISAEEQSDIEAVARWVKAIGAEQVARCMKERDEARAELARLTTPRPIEEAPKDGTPLLGLVDGEWRALWWWDDIIDGARWHLAYTQIGDYKPTHFLPLPVKP